MRLFELIKKTSLIAWARSVERSFVEFVGVVHPRQSRVPKLLPLKYCEANGAFYIWKIKWENQAESDPKLCKRWVGFRNRRLHMKLTWKRKNLVLEMWMKNRECPHLKISSSEYTNQSRGVGRNNYKCSPGSMLEDFPLSKGSRKLALHTKKVFRDIQSVRLFMNHPNTSQYSSSSKAKREKKKKFQRKRKERREEEKKCINGTLVLQVSDVLVMLRAMKTQTNAICREKNFECFR